MKDFNALLSKHFKITPAENVDSLSSKDIPEWDSMNYLLFIADVEKEFNTSFSMDEVLGAQSVGDIKKMLRSKSIDV